MQGAFAEQHVRVHEGVRDHAVHRAPQHRQALRRRPRDLQNHAHHGAGSSQVMAPSP